jgi:thioesterase domain-containing protein
VIDALIAIWERVLQRTRIDVEDNFFELGGNPTAANQLFAEITQICGRELSPLTIYQAPTIAALASVLKNPALPTFPPLVKLKAGSEPAPILMSYGIGGSVADLFHLVKHIETRHPVYGLHSPGLDGVTTPLERVEDLAQYFLHAQSALQPHVPIILVGYSFGGLVAFEMARRLSARDNRFPMLIMVESYPYRSYVPLGQKASIATRRAKRLVSKTLRRVGLDTRPSEIPGVRATGRLEVGQRFDPIMQHATRTAELAWRSYDPLYYEGKINFAQAMEIDAQFPDDPTSVWGKLADEFLIETVPGDHYDVLAKHAKALAATISRYVEENPQ